MSEEVKKYVTTYMVVEGHKFDFESEFNDASTKGYIYCGNMNSIVIDGDVVYSQLMMKTTEVKKH